MQTFTCPQCGSSSAFDPLTESAHCPDCGYAPPPPGTVRLEDLLPSQEAIQDSGPARATIIQLYHRYKWMAPDYIMLIRKDEWLYTFGGDAGIVVQVCGPDLLVEEEIPGARPPVARLPFDKRETYMYQVEGAGYKIGMGGSGILDCPQCGHATETRDIFSPSIRCTHCGYVSLEHDDQVQERIDQGIVAAKAGDREKAHRLLGWALKNATKSEQRATAWLWLAEVTPGLYEKRDYLQKTLAENPSQALVSIAQSKLVEVSAILAQETEVEAPADHPLVPADTQVAQPTHARRFTCQRCGGTLRFSPGGEALACPYCGQSQETDKGRAASGPVAEQPFWAAMASLKGHTRPASRRAFVCPGCGVSFMLTPETLSLTCPYCASGCVIEETTRPELIAPTGVIPFQVTHTEAETKLREWLIAEGEAGGGNPAPLTGVYLPLWTFDLGGLLGWEGDVQLAWILSLPKAGNWQVTFDDILVPASHKFPALLLDEMQRFDLSKMVPYDPAYLADWPAQLYEISMSDATLEARGKALEAFKVMVARRYGRISNITVQSKDLQVPSFKLILLPVWITHSVYQGKRHRLIVNGQTGAVRGEKHLKEGTDDS